MSYKVRQGDTLSSIAARNNVSVGDLMKANPQIKNPDKIITGWVLNLPMKSVPGKQGDGFSMGTAKPPRTGPNLDGAAQPLAAKPMNGNGATAPAAPAPAPAAPPASVAAMQTARANTAATITPADVAQLSATAQKNEATVMNGAKQLAAMTDPAAAAKAYTQLKTDYATWQGSVQKLVQAGQLGDPAVKSFASKSEQAQVLQNNIPPELMKTPGASYSKAVEAQIANDCVATKGQTAKAVVADNPMLDVPPLGSKPSIESAKARGIPTTSVTIEGKTAEVRKDVVMVFAPGVVRTNNEFTDMRHEAMDDGIASTRAETGTFIDPDKNAEAIATAIKQAKDMVGNPNAKVLLVGYSQGNTNVYAFMRDKDGKYGDLTKDVVGIHDIHSAARGSDLADCAFAVGQYLTSPNPLDPHQQALVDAYCKATAKTLHLPDSAATVFQGGMKALRAGIQDSGAAITKLESFAAPLLAKIGIHAPTHEQVNKGLMKVAIEGTKVDDILKAHGGKAGAAVAGALQPFMDALKDNPAEWLRHPTMSPFFQKYVDGGLKSLTTDYGGQLMNDPNLQKNVKNVAILNSVGSIPQEREKELVPNSQKLLFNFFHELGQDNDYEVSLNNQKLEAVIPHAVDLPPDAIGHWGVTGVTVPYDHGPEYFKNWKPGGMTDSVLTTFQNMGVI